MGDGEHVGVRVCGGGREGGMTGEKRRGGVGVSGEVEGEVGVGRGGGEGGEVGGEGGGW